MLPTVTSARPHGRAMRCIIIGVLAALLWSLGASGTSAAASAGGGARVTSGTDVTASTYAARWRSIVSLQYQGMRNDRDGHVCGGTLIAPRLVVTAAHCVYDEGLGIYFAQARLEVLTGVRTLQARALTEDGRYAVESVFIHPQYKPSVGFFDAPNPGWDVAVLRLAAPVVPADGVPMQLIDHGEQAMWGGGAGLASGARIAGWGLTLDPYTPQTEPIVPPTALQEAAIPIHDDAVCERSSSAMGASSDLFTRVNMLCTGTLDSEAGVGTNRVGACFGDSGGPMIVPDGAGGWRLVGVTSWGPAGCNSFSIYGRVPAFRDWIATIDENRFGAGGLQPATNVRHQLVGPHGVRLRWDHAGPQADRFRLYQRQFIRVRGGSSVGVVVLDYGRPGRADEDQFLEIGIPVGGAGRNARVHLLDDVAPRRPGQQKFHYFALEVVDAAGNKAPRQNIRVSAPIDRMAPTLPGVPRPISYRGRSPKLWWRNSTDNDQVNRYVVQLRVGDGAWRTWTGTRLGQCGFFCFGFWQAVTPAQLEAATEAWTTAQGGQGFGENPANVVYLRNLRGGTTYGVRVIAIDRAGNRRVSNAGSFTVRMRGQAAASSGHGAGVPSQETIPSPAADG